MNNKKGVFFGIYLCFLTLLMIGTVIYLYHQQKHTLSSSLVSPLIVLTLQDHYEVFMMREEELVNTTFKELTTQGLSTREKEFIDQFRTNFFKKFYDEPKLKLFIEKDLTINGKKVSPESYDYEAFIENYLYPLNGTSFKEGRLIFTRASIGKTIELNNDDISKIGFPLTLHYEYHKTYSLI